MRDLEYRNNPAVSQSFLKELEGHPKYLTLRDKKESRAFDIGNVVDTLLTDPDSFYHKYQIFQGKVPTNKLKLWADKYVEFAIAESEYSTINHMELILRSRTAVEYDARLSAPKVLELFNTECYDYVTFCLENKGKTILSLEDDAYCRQMVNSTLYDEKLSKWFTSTEYATVLFQQELYSDYYGSYNGSSFTVACKALPDIIWIDHLNEEIILLDIKTYEGDFIDNYWKYKYYYQADFYLWNLVNHKNETLIPKNYKIKDFYFIAIDKQLFKGSVLYKHNPEYHTKIWSGGLITDKKGRNHKLKGLTQLFREYYYHSSTGNWDHPFEYLTRNHILL